MWAYLSDEKEAHERRIHKSKLKHHIQARKKVAPRIYILDLYKKEQQNQQTQQHHQQ